MGAFKVQTARLTSPATRPYASSREKVWTVTCGSSFWRPWSSLLDGAVVAGASNLLMDYPFVVDLDLGRPQPFFGLEGEERGEAMNLD